VESPGAPEPAPVAVDETKRDPAPSSGTLSINSVPWAQVSIDGRPIGHTPLRRVALPSGPHQVRLVDARAKTVSRRVTIEPGREAKLGVDFDE
jgi:serine/threonine-protein kinase